LFAPADPLPSLSGERERDESKALRQPGPRHFLLPLPVLRKGGEGGKKDRRASHFLLQQSEGRKRRTPTPLVSEPSWKEGKGGEIPPGTWNLSHSFLSLLREAGGRKKKKSFYNRNGETSPSLAKKKRGEGGGFLGGIPAGRLLFSAGEVSISRGFPASRL